VYLILIGKNWIYFKETAHLNMNSKAGVATHWRYYWFWGCFLFGFIWVQLVPVYSQIGVGITGFSPSRGRMMSQPLLIPQEDELAENQVSTMVKPLPLSVIATPKRGVCHRMCKRKEITSLTKEEWERFVAALRLLNSGQGGLDKTVRHKIVNIGGNSKP
jgi:hypothetical protein